MHEYWKKIEVETYWKWLLKEAGGMSHIKWQLFDQLSSEGIVDKPKLAKYLSLFFFPLRWQIKSTFQLFHCIFYGNSILWFTILNIYQQSLLMRIDRKTSCFRGIIPPVSLDR